MKMRKVPKEAYEWAEGLFRQDGFIIYERKGRKVKGFCTACGRTYEGPITYGESYESAFERVYEKPVHNMDGRCPSCKKRIVYKARGLCTHTERFWATWTIGQRMGEDFVFRIFESRQETLLPYAAGFGYGLAAYTQIETEEKTRIFLQKGKKRETYYYAPYYDDWRKGASSLYEGRVYEGTEKEIRSTPMLKYGNPGRHGVIEYYSAFARYPDMEMVEKAGMTKLVEAMIRQTGANINPRGKNPWDRLRIYKCRMKDLKEVKGELIILRAFQQERRLKKHWKQEEVEQEKYLLRIWDKHEADMIREALKYTTLHKLQAYLKKNDIMQRRYADYIRMRLEQGYDISDSIKLFPKDFERRHAEMILEKEKAKMDKRKREVEEKYPQIKEKFKRLNKRYGYEKDDYLIRPAQSAAEIVEEGRVLHHCVGGDSYLSSHAKGNSFILFLRKKEQPELPFCTIEIKGRKIVQWYEAYDEKPDEKILQPLLDEYTQGLEGKNARNHVQKAV